MILWPPDTVTMSNAPSLSDRLKAWKSDKTAPGTANANAKRPTSSVSSAAAIAPAATARRTSAQPAPTPASSSAGSGRRSTTAASPGSPSRRRGSSAPHDAASPPPEVDTDADALNDVGYLQTALKQLLLLKYRLLIQVRGCRRARCAGRR